MDEGWVHFWEGRKGSYKEERKDQEEAGSGDSLK